MECDLIKNPDFSDMEKLTGQIETQTKKFIKDIEDFLDSFDQNRQV
jgi:hypothetical protein